MKFGCQQFCSNWQSMQIVVNSKNSLFQYKLQSKLYHFNRHELGFLTKECYVKNDSIGLRSRIKNPTPCDFDSATLIPHNFFAEKTVTNCAGMPGRREGLLHICSKKDQGMKNWFSLIMR